MVSNTIHPRLDFLSKKVIKGLSGRMDRVHFKYVKPPNYCIKYANGCFGGITPKGEIFLNFFAESLPVPDEERFELDENGELLAPKQEGAERVIQRELVSGIVLTKESAQEICYWLQSMLKTVEGKE